MAAIGQQDKNSVSEIQAVILRLRDEEFGVEIVNVREITRMMDITTINEPAGFISGVVNLRGQVIVVVDLARQLGFLAMEKIPETARIVFIELRKKNFGLIVDQVSDVVKVSLEHAGSSLGNIQTVVQTEYIKGIGLAVNGPIIVLDLEKVFLKFIKD